MAMAGLAQEVAGAAPAPEPGITERTGSATLRPGRRASHRLRRDRCARRLWAAAFTTATIALFAAYIRLSATYPVNSDGANIVLMSWDMLHGNLLLHGWWMSDVSFYTTELPGYMLIDAIRGLSSDVAHIAAALTYTLVLVLTVLLARSRATARDGAVRVLIAGGIMLAPQLGVGVFALLLSVGHIGTAVPALAAWLILDRAPRRWYVPVITACLLGWAMVADSLVLVVAIVPLALVGVARALWWPAGGTATGGGPGTRGGPGTAQRMRSAWYELSLAGAAITAAGISWLLQRAIHAAGGYTVHHLPFSLVTPAKLGVHAATTGGSLLALFGANFGGLHSGAAVAFAVLHLAGLALVAWALGRTFRRFASCGLIDQVLAVTIVVNLATYLFSSFSSGVLNGREIALVLPFGAALAARSLAPELLAALQPQAARAARVPAWLPAWLPARLLLTVLAGTMLAGNGACLGYELAQPVSPPANARLASWLQARHLTHGLSGYWQASVVTVGTGGRVTIRAVSTADGGLVPYRWEAKAPWYDPGTQYANFVVLQNQAGFFNDWQPARETLATFGPPEQTFHTGPYTVLVYQQNLMNALHAWAVRAGAAAGTAVTS
jgi:hypothetical protein